MKPQKSTVIGAIFAILGLIFTACEAPLDNKTEYSITFESNGGSAVNSQIVTEGEKVVRPANPTKNGFVFDNWNANEGLTIVYDFNQPVNSDITLYAKWYPESTGTDPDDPLELIFEAINNNAAYRITGYTGNSNGSEVVIPATYKGKPVTEIGDNAFIYSDLTSVEIPNSVTSISETAFYYCSSLTSITVDSENQYYASNEEGILFTKDKTELLAYPAGKAGAYTIPSSVLSIGSRAFFSAESLTVIEIPNNVTSINDKAFQGCIGLTSVTIPASVTSIDSFAFGECKNLTGVIFAEGSQLKTVGSAFYGCTSLTNVIIPESALIADEAFYGCTSLVSVIIPDGVPFIGNGAFYGCTSLTSVIIPASVTFIGNVAFADCSSLTSIIVDSENQHYASNEEGILFTKDKTALLTYPAGKVGAYTIPTDTTLIYLRAFSGSSLTSVTIPASVTIIDDYAFYGWTASQTISVQGYASQWDADFAWSYWRGGCNANIVYQGNDQPPEFSSQGLIGTWTKQLGSDTLILILDGTNWTLSLRGMEGDMYGTYTYIVDRQNVTLVLTITEDGEVKSFTLGLNDATLMLYSTSIWLDWTYALNGYWTTSENTPADLIGTWATVPGQTMANLTGFVITATKYIQYTNGTPGMTYDLFINEGTISAITSICGEYYFTHGKADYSLNSDGTELTLSNSVNSIGIYFENRVYYMIE